MAANVTVDFNQATGNITFQVSGAVAKTKNIRTLNTLLDPAVTWRDANEFIEQQKYINYLDTIKDGAVKGSQAQANLLGQITVTPDQNGNAMYGDMAQVPPHQRGVNGIVHPWTTAARVDAQGAQVQFPNWNGSDNDHLHALEEAIIQAADGQITTSTALPKSNGKGRIASLLEIDKVFHDAGNGPEAYCKPGVYKLVNNIGTYIDPATDMDFKEVYPARGEQIQFTNRFMNLFGLGGPPGPAGGPANGFESEIVARATSLRTFEYQIKCYGQQFDQNANPADSDQYRWVFKQGGPPATTKPQAIFIGNPEKNRQIWNRSRMSAAAAGGAADPGQVAAQFAIDTQNFTHSRNLLAGKEWGDKMQVIAVLVYKMLNPGKRYILLTNDKVVFALAISLGVQTIWNGVVQQVKTIKHFKPENPREILAAIKMSFKEKRKQVFDNNKQVIKNLRWLSNHPGDALERANAENDWHFSKEFYTKIADDLSTINDNFLKDMKLSNPLEKYAKTNQPQGIVCIRKLKDYLKYFSFKDIITQGKGGRQRKFTTHSDRYTDLILPFWTQTAPQLVQAAAEAAARINPAQTPLPPLPVPTPAPAGWSNAGAQIGVWAIAHQFYNLKELLTLMIESGAKIGDIYKKNFDDAAAAAMLVPPLQPPQAISFFYAARPFGILSPATFSAVAPYAWQGHQIPPAYQQRRAPIAGGGPRNVVVNDSPPKVQSGKRGVVPMPQKPAPVKKDAAAAAGVTPGQVKTVFRTDSTRSKVRSYMDDDNPEGSSPVSPGAASYAPTPEASQEVYSHSASPLPAPPHSASPLPAPPPPASPAVAPVPDVAPKLADLYKPLTHIENQQITLMFQPTELNTEPFTVTDINKRTGEYITIDINKRLRDIITLKTGLPETNSMHEEICKEFLETSEKLYIHEFDEVIENDDQSNEMIRDFNEVINTIYAKYNPGKLPKDYNPRGDPITQLDLLQAKVEEVIALVLGAQAYAQQAAAQGAAAAGQDPAQDFLQQAVAQQAAADAVQQALIILARNPTTEAEVRKLAQDAAPAVAALQAAAQSQAGLSHATAYIKVTEEEKAEAEAEAAALGVADTGGLVYVNTLYAGLKRIAMVNFLPDSLPDDLSTLNNLLEKLYKIEDIIKADPAQAAAQNPAELQAVAEQAAAAAPAAAQILQETQQLLQKAAGNPAEAVQQLLQAPPAVPVAAAAQAAVKQALAAQQAAAQQASVQQAVQQAQQQAAAGQDPVATLQAALQVVAQQAAAAAQAYEQQLLHALAAQQIAAQQAAGQILQAAVDPAVVAEQAAQQVAQQVAQQTQLSPDGKLVLSDLIYEQIYPLSPEVIAGIQQYVAGWEPEEKDNYIDLIINPMINSVKQQIILLDGEERFAKDVVREAYASPSAPLQAAQAEAQAGALAQQAAALAQQAAAGAGAGSAGGGKKKKQTKRKKKKNTKRKGKRSNIKKTKNKKKRASNGQKKKKKKTKRGRKSKN